MQRGVPPPPQSAGSTLPLWLSAPRVGVYFLGRQRTLSRGLSLFAEFFGLSVIKNFNYFLTRVETTTLLFGALVFFQTGWLVIFSLALSFFSLQHDDDDCILRLAWLGRAVEIFCHSRKCVGVVWRRMGRMEGHAHFSLHSEMRGGGREREKWVRARALAAWRSLKWDRMFTVVCHARKASAKMIVVLQRTLLCRCLHWHVAYSYLSLDFCPWLRLKREPPT